MNVGRKEGRKDKKVGYRDRKDNSRRCELMKCQFSVFVYYLFSSSSYFIPTVLIIPFPFLSFTPRRIGNIMLISNFRKIDFVFFLNFNIVK